MSRTWHKLGNLELHHKIAAFIGVVCLTILFMRTGTLLYDPNPKLWGFEIHHFDYGVILLVISTLLLLFRRGAYPVAFALSAIAIGMVLDELWFVRGAVTYSGSESIAVYRHSLSNVTILVLVLFALTFFVDHFKRRGPR